MPVGGSSGSIGLASSEASSDASALVRSLVQSSLSKRSQASPTGANGGGPSTGTASSPAGGRCGPETQQTASSADPLPVVSPSAGPPSLETLRAQKFQQLLSADVVNLQKLCETSWGGIPPSARAESWQLLLGYLPSNREWRAATLQRKRREYCEAVPQYFEVADSERSEYQQTILHQILIDVPRTSPASSLFHHEVVQRALERILYIWALRHPASGYVQGINDLVTPFFMAFLSTHLPQGRPHSREDVDQIEPHVLAQVEADSYWCLSKLIDSIQDHYTFAQPGIQRMVFKLKELVARIDSKLHNHLVEQGLHFIQFAFRWMNCLLMRELSLDLILRVWDTYLAEHGGSDGDADSPSDGLAVLHVYTCAALLVRWSAELQKMEFQELVHFLQHLPTTGWSNKEVGELLSQAYVFKTLYHNAPSHLACTT